ncbi:MAG: hypothetical protein NkDv07_0345 [Candidatus Improbicoccus devescovinae]|nr:MAG: hypothetical protein NkDv07_0345 [Candidatus Improbicoccus devescovinae]
MLKKFISAGLVALTINSLVPNMATFAYNKKTSDQEYSEEEDSDYEEEDEDDVAEDDEEIEDDDEEVAPAVHPLGKNWKASTDIATRDLMKILGVKFPVLFEADLTRDADATREAISLKPMPPSVEAKKVYNEINGRGQSNASIEKKIHTGTLDSIALQQREFDLYLYQMQQRKALAFFILTGQQSTPTGVLTLCDFTKDNPDAPALDATTPGKDLLEMLSPFRSPLDVESVKRIPQQPATLADATRARLNLIVENTKKNKKEKMGVAAVSVDILTAILVQLRQTETANLKEVYVNLTNDDDETARLFESQGFKKTNTKVAKDGSLVSEYTFDLVASSMSTISPSS